MVTQASHQAQTRKLITALQDRHLREAQPRPVAASATNSLPSATRGPGRMGTFQDEIGFLGIESSPSFVRQPEGNGVAERFIRTLKENFLWVHTFGTIEELRRELQDFVAHYNATWLVARHGYRTPNQVRAEQRRLAPCPPANLPLAA